MLYEKLQYTHDPSYSSSKPITFPIQSSEKYEYNYDDDEDDELKEYTTLNARKLLGYFSLLSISIIFIFGLFYTCNSSSSLYSINSDSTKDDSKFSQFNFDLDFDLDKLVHYHFDDDKIEKLSNLLDQVKLNKNRTEHCDDANDNNTNTINIDKRKEKEKQTESEKLLKKPYIRFLMAVAAMIGINMLAICIQHVYTKIKNSSNDYRNVEHTISPF